ncbi:fused response regulator/phosphatase [Bacterioplanes sanyensis]|uniref:Fused response regulator/phosphatase n=1 Tax=Bacterioplanes sanyensis TaxID=1249553 RepID=A0A222FL52_9GAMM|nr:fused response regulator/phosphatase [Bacterioplanes sanyensis]ASP39738.1 fused response regulator/phosphatase [Bacterioplanes sanyensis]
MAAAVLVIDDDSERCQRHVHYLHKRGYQAQAHQVSDNVSGWLQDHPVAAVVCALGDDLSFELLATFKQHFTHAPLVVLSPSSDSNDVLQALRMGADDYLILPLDNLEVLGLSVDKAVQHARIEAENQAYREHLEVTNRELRRHLDELRNDQQAGRQAQLRMLPEPITKMGINLSHRVIPSLLLSGDFLDYFELDQRRLVFYVADVSGHGASSAFVTVLLKNLTYRLRRNLRRGSSDDLNDPSRVLQRINSELLASQLGKHLTILYAIYDLVSSELVYSVGGHLPMPVLVVDGHADYLEGSGMPVGLFEGAKYQNYRMKLPEPFTLWMFSDGILEIIDQPTLNDKEAQLLSLAVSAEGSPERLINSLGLQVDAEVPDDIAMLAVNREGI